MGVYKYDAINDELIPIAGVPSVPGIEDKVSTYTADATYWDTSPTAASIKPVTSGGIKTEIDKKLSTYAVDSTAWDAAPTTGSTKPVISDGIKTQFDKANNELADVNNILGSKNILPNKATTQVINGVTFTVSADGSINVNGTATADAILHLIPNTTGKLSAFFSKGGNYIISTGTTGAGPNVFFGIEYTGSTWDIGEWLTYSTQTSKEIYIDGSKLNNASSVIECYVKVNSGTTVSNKKVYPMLRPSNIKDATYVPYSKTNYELTTEISNLANALSKKDLVYIGNANPAYPKTFSGNYKEILVIACPWVNATNKIWVSTYIPISFMGALPSVPNMSTNMKFRQHLADGGNVDIQVVKSNSQYTVSISTDLSTGEPWCCIFGKE